MKPSEPPELATWLLEHFVLGNKNEALAGDLLEEFRQRCSVAWYWRQVLGAILVGFLSELRAEWFSVVYAVGWTCAVSVSWKHLKMSPQLQFLLGWAIEHNWPQSLIYATTIYITTMAAIVWVGLSFYLVMMCSFDLRRFFRGFATFSSRV
jgi:hypothetical protein